MSIWVDREHDRPLPFESNPAVQALTSMPWVFYLTGSWFFAEEYSMPGRYTRARSPKPIPSDVDFFVQDQDGIRAALRLEGFHRIGEEATYIDSNTAEVYRHTTHSVDVQIVRDVKLKRAVQGVLFAQNFTHAPKEMWDRLFLFMHELLYEDLYKEPLEEGNAPPVSAMHQTLRRKYNRLCKVTSHFKKELERMEL